MKTLRKMPVEQETNAFIGLKKEALINWTTEVSTFQTTLFVFYFLPNSEFAGTLFSPKNEIVSAFGFHSLWNSLCFCWLKKFGSSRHKYTYTYFCQLIKIDQHFPKILTEKSEISWKRNKFNFETFSSKLLVSL